MCGSGSRPTIENCTILDNYALCYGGGLGEDTGDLMYVSNCIVRGNEIDQIFGSAVVTYSDIQGGWHGEGNIDADPLFVAGPLGEFYLSQTAAGQPVDSPCVNAGSDTAENLGLDVYTTRTDHVGDAGVVDMGYHYPIDCLGDLDGDNDTDQADLGVLLASWGIDADGDLDGDGDTDQADLGILLADWGCGS